LQPELKSNPLQRLLAQNRCRLTEFYIGTLPCNPRLYRLGQNLKEKWGISPRTRVGWVGFHAIESQPPTHRANQTEFGTLALEASGSR
jgi:hypothetical protein